MRYSLPELLAAVYKDIEWDRQRFKEGKRINRERKLQAKLTAIEAKMGIQEVGWVHLLRSFVIRLKSNHISRKIGTLYVYRIYTMWDFQGRSLCSH